MSTDTREALAALRAIVALDDEGVLTLVSDQAQSYHTDFVLALQNARAALATQPAQPSAQGEAVAWCPGDPLHDDAYVRGVAVGFAADDSRRTTLLRIADRIEARASAPAAPAQAVPLNFDQLQRVMSQHFGGRELTDDEADSAEAFARAIERAHGIAPKAAQEKTNDH